MLDSRPETQQTRYTARQAADVLDISRARVHQLIEELGLEPEIVTGPDGQSTFLLTPAHMAVLRNRSTKPGPKKRLAEFG